MTQRIVLVAVSMALLSSFHQTSRSGEKKDDRVKAERKKLEGVWVEVHAFAKKKPKGRGSVYAWMFKGDKVHRQHTQTIDGEPVIGSGHSGTYKLDLAGKVNAIDLVLKSPLDEDWKYLGIYKFEGEILKLCMNKDKRPTSFDSKDENRLYVLQRPPKKRDDASKDDLKKLQGRWQPVTIISNGELQKPEKRSIWVISGNKVFYPSFKTEDEIKLDPSKTPKEIDIRVEGDKTFEGIYAIEEDRLKLCIDVEGKGRPSAFESKPGSGHRLLTIEWLGFVVADEVEEKALAAIIKLVGVIEPVTRDESKPARPVVRLNLAATEITDAGLKHLAALAHLRNLALAQTQVTDTGLKNLAGLTELRRLTLNSTKVTDAGLKSLAPLKALEELELSNTKVAGAGLKELAVLKRLQYLGLHGTKVTDAGLKNLAVLAQLQTLVLSDTQLTDAGLKELKPLIRLRVLTLFNTQVTDSGLKELAALKQLQKLSLDETKVTDAGLKQLIVLKQLRNLTLQNTAVTEAGVNKLKKQLSNCEILR